MIFKDLFYVIPLNTEIRVAVFTSVDGETTQKCCACGKLAEIEYDVMTVNIGKGKLSDAKVLQVEPVSENYLQITVLDE